MKTYKNERLCHQFGVKRKHLYPLTSRLHSEGFINMIGDDRYSELEKLINGENKDELFKLIQKIKEESKLWD